jgi:hypothetical protein
MQTKTNPSRIKRTVSLVNQIGTDFLEFFRVFYGRENSPDLAIWRRRSLLLPARTVEGTMETEVWRRLTPDGWEYSRYDASRLRRDV